MEIHGNPTTKDDARQSDLLSVSRVQFCRIGVRVLSFRITCNEQNMLIPLWRTLSTRRNQTRLNCNNIVYGRDLQQIARGEENDVDDMYPTFCRHQKKQNSAASRLFSNPGGCRTFMAKLGDANLEQVSSQNL